MQVSNMVWSALCGSTFDMSGLIRFAEARPFDARGGRLVVAHADYFQEVLPSDGISTTRKVTVATAQS